MSALLSDRVRALCLVHLSDPTFGVDRIAEALDLTERHVRRRLVAETGEGPQALLRRLRIEAAARLIEDGTPVRAAVLAVGYRDASAFRRAYRAVTGRSPDGTIH